MLLICQVVNDILIVKGKANSVNEAKEQISQLKKEGWADMGEFIILMNLISQE